MAAQSNFRKSETFNLLVGAAAVLVIGFGTATAAISVAPNNTINPAMQPLATGSSLHVQSAFGDDDEDCVWVVHKTVQPNGKVKASRKMECAQ
jgi:hypothetical protein